MSTTEQDLTPEAESDVNDDASAGSAQRIVVFSGGLGGRYYSDEKFERAAAALSKVFDEP